MKNRFILFEGVDATGKTTLSKRLAKELNCFYFSSPPKSIRFLKKYADKLPPALRYRYFYLGNVLGSFEIKRLLRKNNVVCDQYIYSTAAYHCVILGKHLKIPRKILHPDTVIYLEASPQKIEKRIEKRGKRKRYEGKDFLPEVDKKYREYIKNINPIFINTENTIEMCLRLIKNQLFSS